MAKQPPGANQTVLITGASSGLGAHFARLYAAAGAAVVIGARRVERVADHAKRTAPGTRSRDVTSRPTAELESLFAGP